MGITALAFDFGTKSIGCAIGQKYYWHSTSLARFKDKMASQIGEAIEKCLKEWKPDVVIVGLPLNMDGTEQDLTLRARKFANRLQGRFGVNVHLQDERLTTTQAQ